MVAPNSDSTQSDEGDSQAKPPVSPRKRAANKVNAAKSTGPRTEDGKSRSRLNATRHGLRAQLPVEHCPQLELVVDDDPNAFDNLHAALVADLQPRGAAEQLIVERLARAAWRLRRTEEAEVAMLDTAEAERVEQVIRVDAAARRDPFLVARPSGRELAMTSLGAALARHFTEQGKGGGLLTLMQYQARLEGQVRSCLRDLRLLRQDRAAWAAERGGGDGDDWVPPKRPRRKPPQEVFDLREVLAEPAPDVSAEVEQLKRAWLDEPYLQQYRRPAPPVPTATPAPTPTPPVAPTAPVAPIASVAPTNEPATQDASIAMSEVPTNGDAGRANGPTAMTVPPAATNEATQAAAAAAAGATNEPTVVDRDASPQPTPASPVRLKTGGVAAPRKSSSPATGASVGTRPGREGMKLPDVEFDSATPPWYREWMRKIRENR